MPTPTPAPASTEPLFTLRGAAPGDLPCLQVICEEGGLARIEDCADCTVAVNKNNEPIGFIHIEYVKEVEKPEGNGAWVYPVAVCASWQHHGVATALIEHALLCEQELRLVACRSSRGFYPKVGFRPLAWSRVATRIAADCKRCPDRKTCDPQPYVLRATDYGSPPVILGLSQYPNNTV